MKYRKISSLIIVFAIDLSIIITPVTVGKSSIGGSRLIEKETIYLAEAEIHYYKTIIDGYFAYGQHTHIHSVGGVYHFDADADEVIIEIVMNYTADMNYTIGFPFVVFAPLIAWGLKVENYSDCVWDAFKLKHDGYAMHDGNLSIEIQFDMDDIESGDEIYLNSSAFIVHDPFLHTSENYTADVRFTCFLFRLAFNLPHMLRDRVLEKLVLPYYAQFSLRGLSTIRIIFD